MRANITPHISPLKAVTVNRLFRTMGMRHLVVVDGELRVVGMITRSEMNEHHLAHYWQQEVRSGTMWGFACYYLLLLFFCVHRGSKSRKN